MFAYDLTVCGRGPLHVPVAGRTGGTDARVAAGREHGDQVAVEDGAVGWGAYRFPAELHLLLGVPQLQRTGALVGRGLLPIRQADGGRQVDLVLLGGVGGLEAAEPVPLHEGRSREPLTLCVSCLQRQEKVHLAECNGGV